jgi:hypothetical protein
MMYSFSIGNGISSLLILFFVLLIWSSLEEQSLQLSSSCEILGRVQAAPPNHHAPVQRGFHPPYKLT